MRWLATVTVLGVLAGAAAYFAAWEQPELFCSEMRDAFRSLR